MNDNREATSMNRDTKVTKFTNGSITVTGNTLSAVFNLDGSTSMVVLSALTQAVKRSSTGNLAYVWYDNASYMNTNDNTVTPSGKNTPGFELLSIIAAVTITAILLKRRR